MFKTVSCTVLLGVALFACTACTAGVTSPSTGSSLPQQQAEITSPASGLRITASIAAVTLGEECGGSSGVAKAPSLDGGGGGGGYCQQSNVQIAFNTGAGSQAARVEVVRVDLLDGAGALLDTLTSSKPQLWSDNGYSAWDQTLKPATDAKTSYDLSAPKWSTLTSDSKNAYSAKYKLHVTLRIDGVEITLESASLSREPAVAT